MISSLNTVIFAGHYHSFSKYLLTTYNIPSIKMDIKNVKLSRQFLLSTQGLVQGIVNYNVVKHQVYCEHREGRARLCNEGGKKVESQEGFRGGW